MGLVMADYNYLCFHIVPVLLWLINVFMLRIVFYTGECVAGLLLQSSSWKGLVILTWVEMNMTYVNAEQICSLLNFDIRSESHYARWQIVLFHVNYVHWISIIDAYVSNYCFNYVHCIWIIGSYDSLWILFDLCGLLILVKLWHKIRYCTCM